MMVLETVRYGRLPIVSARGSLVLAALGGVSILVGLFAGVVLLAPAGLSALLGFLAAFRRALQVSRGAAWAREGASTLAAATVLNGSLALYVALAAFIVLRFGA